MYIIEKTSVGAFLSRPVAGADLLDYRKAVAESCPDFIDAAAANLLLTFL